MDSTAPKITVVICAYNAENRLPKTLAHLVAQTGILATDWEILLVDNASTDSTASVFQTFAAENSHLQWRYVREDTPGTAVARTRGMNAATGSVVLFVDDDNWMEQGYVAGILEALNRLPDAVGVGGVSEVASDIEIPDWFHEYSGWYAVNPKPWSVEPQVEVSELWTAGAAFRRDALREYAKVRHFLTGRVGKSLAAGEDIEMCLYFRLRGFKHYRIPALRFVHFMTPPRLQWTYLEQLHHGSGLTSAALDVYRLNWLNPQVNTFSGRVQRLWLVQILYCVARVVFSTAWMSRQPRPSRLRWFLYLGRVRALWAARHSYQEWMNLPRPS